MYCNDCNCEAFWKRKNHGHNKKISGCQGRRQISRGSTKDFEGSEYPLYIVFVYLHTHTH